MSLNAGAGAGSSCPDVVVERRLRVTRSPSEGPYAVVWSIKIIWSADRTARAGGPGRRGARGRAPRSTLPRRRRPASNACARSCVCMPSCAPRRGASFSARIIRTHGGCIHRIESIQSIYDGFCPLRVAVHHRPSTDRAAGYRPKPRTQAGPSAVGRAASRRATARAAGRTRPTRTV